MRYPATDKYDIADLERLNAEQWQIELLDLNPGYCGWGPHEDYMWKKGDGWDSPKLLDTWDEFKNNWHLDDLNEVANFYFALDRDNEECEVCEGDGYHPESKEVVNGFYGKDYVGPRWCDKITQDECDALIKEGRIRRKDDGTYPSVEEVNEANGLKRGISNNYNHDAINRMILIEQRCKRLGLKKTCEECDGQGYVYTAPTASAQLVLWFLHPRKGCSRGIEIKYLKQEELSEVFDYLKEAARRNAERFSKVLVEEKFRGLPQEEKTALVLQNGSRTDCLAALAEST